MCDLCGFVSRNEISLKKHKYTKHASKSDIYKCIDCSKTFSHRYLLKEHARIHAEPEFKCDQCDSIFKLRRNFVTHSKSHLSINQTIMCKKCPQTFTYESNLKRHMEAKHSDNLFVCAFCQRTFNRRDSLERHVRVCKLKLK